MDEEITQVQRTTLDELPATGMLGNLRLGQPLGQGLLGQVYAAHNTVARKQCAAKVFRRDLPGGAVARGRYIHEAETVAHVGHPNIGHVYGSAMADGRMYTTIELLDGTPLSTLIRQKAPLSRRTYFPLLKEICAGLSAAHAYGIAHRHLHAGQVMVQWNDQSLQVKLLDFGTHHLLPPLKDQIPGWLWRPEHAICVAPEQVKGAAGDVDTRADIYALSIILYEMVTGRVPFLADSFAATLEQHTNDQPMPPSQLVSIPGGLEETIMRGLDKDPRKRIPSVEAMLATLDPLAATTGQHQLTRAKLTSTGRYRVLTADVSQEIQLPDAPVADLQQPAREPPHRTAFAPFKIPRSRKWLYVLLAVVAIGCGVAVTLLLLDDEPEPARRPTIPSVRQGRALRTPAKSPGARPGPRKQPTGPVARRPTRPVPKQGPTTAGAKRLGRLAGRPITKALGFGALEIATSSPEAQVFVNGRFKGKGKLVLLPRIAAGTYRIHLVIDGKKTPHRDVQLAPNQRLTISF